MTESVIYKTMIAGAEQQGDDDKDYKEETYLGNYLRFKMKREGKRFWAGDNISEYIDNEHVISVGAYKKIMPALKYV